MDLASVPALCGQQRSLCSTSPNYPYAGLPPEYLQLLREKEEPYAEAAMSTVCRTMLGL